MDNLQFTEGWPSKILSGSIRQKDLVDQVVNHLLTNYDLERPPGDINDQNIFKDPFFEKFKKEVVIPAFDHWLRDSMNTSISSMNKDYSMRAWITGVYNGYNIITHNHSGAHLSAVFYLFNDAPQSGGEIIFFDPRANANRGYKSEWNSYFSPFTMKVPSYTFAVFPSFIYHQTTPFGGNMRLAMPVDLFI